VRERVIPDGAPPLSPSADHQHVAPGEAWRGLRGGLMPLAVVVVCMAATVGLTVVARHLLAGSGFFAAQRAGVIVLAGGGIVSALQYAIAGIRALRRLRAWQQDGRTACAGGGLCGLGVTALVVALPLLLAVLLPQHPAP
jgi:hypothetical protein